MKIILLWCVIFLACLGPNIYAQNSVRANFGNYPADNGIAFFNTIGYSRAPTVRELFGPNASFVKTFNGVPATVILESGSGSRNEFTGILLLSITNPDTNEVMRVLRMRVTFQHDNSTGLSHVRHIVITNLISAQVSEQVSRGSQIEDGRVFGLFAGMFEYFWDL